jgi:hypothetical protein
MAVASAETCPPFAPSKVLSPTAFSQPRGATLTRRISQTHRLRYALRVSHPLDVLLPPRPAGLISSRYRSWGSPFGVSNPPHSVVHPVGCRLPHEVSCETPQRSQHPLQGLVHYGESRTKSQRFRLTPVRLPPWALSPPRHLTWTAWRIRKCATSPHVLCRYGRKLTLPLAPQGIIRPKCSQSLSRLASLPGVLHLVEYSRIFGLPAALGLWFSLGSRPTLPRSCYFLFMLPSDSLPELTKNSYR